jgi:hypothetical protein
MGCGATGTWRGGWDAGGRGVLYSNCRRLTYQLSICRDIEKKLLTAENTSSLCFIPVSLSMQ